MGPDRVGRSLLPVLAVAAIAFAASCSSVPVTGRRQLILVPQSEMMAMSAQQYGEFLEKNPPSRDAAQTERVRRVGQRIQVAVEKYMTQSGQASRLSGYNWQFNLVESQEINAWCMPGGKVVVYTGLLPVAKDDTGLAVVMGHEIAHAIAEHGAERMSQQLLAESGGAVLGEMMKSKPAETQAMWMQAFGAGAQYGALLPFSRLQESEADRLGLIFMAMAGYDPAQAVEFWKRMSQASGGQKPPEFLSTHPADETRIRKIQEALPEAQAHYAKP